MREHEVPTHVQAEDRVLFWLTFPQVVSLIAVAAVGYGVFNYAPGPAFLRISLAVGIGVIGATAAVGQIGGRRLPLVVADVLKFWLGPRRFEGQTGDLLRPAPVVAIEPDPGLMDTIWEKGRRRFRRLCKSRHRRNGDKAGSEPKSSSRGRTRHSRRSKKEKRSGRITFGRRRWVAVGAMALLAIAGALPQAVIATGEEDRGRIHVSEVDLTLPAPVLGRRAFVEEMTVTADRLNVTVRAATDISLRARAYGGENGGALRFSGLAALDENETAAFNMPLEGSRPSFTFAWVDSLGQAGAVTLTVAEIPYPLPSADGDLCDAEVTSLTLSRSLVNGVISTDCEESLPEMLELKTVSGLGSVEVLTVRDAEVTRVGGMVTVGFGGRETSVPLVADGETSFSLGVDPVEGTRDVSVDLDLDVSLRIPVPPLVEMTLVPEETVEQSHVVSVVRPGVSRNVSETVTITCADGTEERHQVSARLSIPSKSIEKTATVPVTLNSYVTAQIVAREPVIRSRDETIELESVLWADAPFTALAIPEPEPTPEEAEHRRVSSGVAEDLFARLGWEWPW